MVEQAGVWLGEEDTVPLVTEGDIKISLPRASRRGLKVKVVYEGPVPAPIEEGSSDRQARDRRSGIRDCGKSRSLPAPT